MCCPLCCSSLTVWLEWVESPGDLSSSSSLFSHGVIGAFHRFERLRFAVSRGRHPKRKQRGREGRGNEGRNEAQATKAEWTGAEKGGSYASRRKESDKAEL